MLASECLRLIQNQAFRLNVIKERDKPWSNNHGVIGLNKIRETSLRMNVVIARGVANHAVKMHCFICLHALRSRRLFYIVGVRVLGTSDRNSPSQSAHFNTPP